MAEAKEVCPLCYHPQHVDSLCSKFITRLVTKDEGKGPASKRERCNCIGPKV